MSYRKHHVKSKIKKLKPKKSVLKNKWFWLAILVAIIAFIILYILLFSKFLSINNINISGNKDIRSEDILNISNDNINKKLFSLGSWQIISRSIFLTNSSYIQQQVLNKFPKIDEILVNKKMFQTLEVKVKEREAVAVFCSNQANKDCYFVDRKGVAFDFLETMPTGFFVIEDTKEAVAGMEIVSQNIVENILKIKEMLKNSYDIDVIDALITTPLRLNVRTSENWQVYFSIDSDLNMQITKLDLLLKGEIPENIRKKLQYIDLRFKDRAYYK